MPRSNSLGPVVELRGATCVYGSGPHAVTALRPTTMQLRDGEYLAVMGASGSGKSTLLNIMGLLIRPTAGTVLAANTSVADLGDAAISALRGVTLGFVFQSYHLLPTLTASENVELPLVYQGLARPQRRALSHSALERMGLLARSEALPHELSGGERQRIAIARATVTRPRALLCDEPTGNLDSRSSSAVLALIDELNLAGIAVVLVTHDPIVASRARRQLRVTDGIVTELHDDHIDLAEAGLDA